MFTLLAVALVTVTEWFRSKLVPQSLVTPLTFPRVRVGPTTIVMI